MRHGERVLRTLAWPGIGLRKKPSVFESSKLPVPNCIVAIALRDAVRAAAAFTEKAAAWASAQNSTIARRACIGISEVGSRSARRGEKLM